MQNAPSEVRMGILLGVSAWKQDPPGPEVSVEEVAKRAFRMARDDNYTWYTSNDDHQFRIGVGILLMHYKDTPTEEEIRYSLKAIQALSAMMSGIPVDLGAVVDDEREALPLIPWYRETAA